jgi:hypothetical protein
MTESERVELAIRRVTGTPPFRNTEVLKAVLYRIADEIAKINKENPSQ